MRLPPPLANALSLIGIHSATDLLFSAPPSTIFARLPQNSVSLHELVSYIELVAKTASAPGVPGNVLFAREQEKAETTRVVSGCGVRDVDALIGRLGNQVVEISGDQASGKSALALQIVLHHLSSDPFAKALWIDTSGDFSVERVKVMQDSGIFKGSGTTSVLERLQISLVFDIDAAHDVLETIQSPSSAFHLVIIDTITYLVAPHLSAVTSQGHALMTSFMRHLRSLAQSNSMTVLVINNTSTSAPHNPQSAFGSTVRKPALGPSFTFLTDTTIWVAKCDREEGVRGTRHVVEVFRSKVTVEDMVCLDVRLDRFIVPLEWDPSRRQKN